MARELFCSVQTGAMWWLLRTLFTEVGFTLLDSAENHVAVGRKVTFVRCCTETEQWSGPGLGKAHPAEAAGRRLRRAPKRVTAIM